MVEAGSWETVNDSYFHAIVKDRNKSNGISRIEDDDGKVLTFFEDIERETLRFYHRLVGQSMNMMNGVDMIALREGKHVSEEDFRNLTKPRRLCKH